MDKITSPLMLAPCIFVIATILLSVGHARLRNPRLIAKTCEKCGTSFFISESPNQEWCSQCVNLYIHKDDLPSESKLKKYAEVKKYKSWNRRIQLILQLLLPGSKSILQSSPWIGWITLTFWIFLLVFCFYPVKDLPYPYLNYLNDYLIFYVFIWGSTLFYWIIFGLRAIWKED